MSGRKIGVGWLLAASMLIGAGFAAPRASADPIAIGGDPMTVYVDSLGQCQSAYADTGGNYYPGDSDTGDCGFFIATPSEPADQLSELQGQVFGFDGNAGPTGAEDYDPVSQSDVSGDGSSVSPYRQVTVYDVDGPESGDPLLQITQTTTYVSGALSFTAYYDVQNITDQLDPSDDNYDSPIYFRAIYAGDLYVDGDDQGTGIYRPGPPAFVGGENAETGAVGGFEEATAYFDGSSVPPWDSYAEDYWSENGIWDDVDDAADAAEAFPDTVSSTLWDNGAGVAWDTDYTTPLEPGADQKFAIINLTSIPATTAPSTGGGSPTPHQPSGSANPCRPVHGSLGRELLASLKCTAAETLLEVKCGAAIATWIIPVLKGLKIIKAAKTLDVLAKVLPARLYPAARLIWDLLHTPFLKHAPPGYRSAADIIGKLKQLSDIRAEAKELMEILPKLAKAISSRAWGKIATDLADIAGLHSCVEGLALASS